MALGYVAFSDNGLMPTVWDTSKWKHFFHNPQIFSLFHSTLEAYSPSKTRHQNLHLATYQEICFENPGPDSSKITFWCLHWGLNTKKVDSRLHRNQHTSQWWIRCRQLINERPLESCERWKIGYCTRNTHCSSPGLMENGTYLSHQLFLWCQDDGWPWLPLTSFG